MTMFTEGRLQTYEHMMQQTYMSRSYSDRHTEKAVPAGKSKKPGNSSRRPQATKGGEGHGSNQG